MTHALTIEQIPQIADCAACPLAARNDGIPLRPVRGYTDNELNQVRVIVVMEAPGGSEHYEGKPAVGQSGQALDVILAQQGIKREDVFVTNTLLCRPGGNRDPEVSELEACYSRLHYEIMSMPNRHVIVCMGNYAAQVIQNDLRISIMKKMFDIDWSDTFGCHVVYAFHPAFVLRNPDVYVDVDSVIETTAKLLDEPLEPIAQHVVERRIAATSTEALELLNDVLTNSKGDKVCAADIETDHLEGVSDVILEIGFCYKPGFALIVPWSFVRTNVAVYKAMKNLLERTDIRWTWHNGKFDVSHIRKQNIRATIQEDTMLLHFALDERSSSDEDEGTKAWSAVHGLKPLARKYLRAHQWEATLDQYLPNRSDPWSQIPDDVRHEYLSYDVHFTYLLLLDLHARLAREAELDPSLRDYPYPVDCYYKYTIPAANALSDLEVHGLHVNVDYLEELGEKIREPLEQSANNLVNVVGEIRGEPWPDFNPNSGQQVAVVIYDLLKCPPWRKRGHRDSKVGPRTTNKKTLIEYSEKYPSPFFEALLEHRRQAKIYSTYIRGIFRRIRDGKVHPDFKLHGAVTGRMACKRPNMQNIQRNNDIKRMFIPPEGHTFVISDYAQLEMRIVAHLSQDANLVHSLTVPPEGEVDPDFHWFTARDVFKQIAAERVAAKGNAVELRAIIRRHNILREIDERNDIDNMDADKLYKIIRWRLRNASKWVSFGILFGRTAYTLASGELNCPKDEAQSYVDAWFERYNSVNDYISVNRERAFNLNWVEMKTGRRRRFPFICDENKIAVANQSLNAPIQGMASELNTASFVKLRYKLVERGYGWPLFLVHDSIAFEILTSALEPATKLIRETMESVISDPNIPFPVDISAGPSWGDVVDI